MPVYAYQCINNHENFEYRAMNDRNQTPLCAECEEPTRLIISIPKAKPSFGNEDTRWNMRERHRLGKG
jgi:hypothetical protein